MAQSTYRLISLTADLTLTWAFSFQGGVTIADKNDVNPNQNGWQITLPNATLASIGETFLFNNIAAFDFDIMANDGTTLLTTVSAGEVYEFYLYDSSTANGLWRIIPYGSGTNAIVSLTAQSTNSSIVITNGNITPPGGVINFKLPTNINNLNNVSSVGFVVINGSNPLTWKTVELIDGENIIITNPDGIDSDPVINLNPVVTGVTSLQVGEMTLSGSVITSDVVNGNIQLNTNGTGEVQINGITIDPSGNMQGVNNITITGNLNIPGSNKAYFTFTDKIVGLSNVIVVQDQFNIASVTGGNGTYTANFIEDLPNINYGVFISLGTTQGPLPLVSHAYSVIKELDSVTIVVVDASGEPVISVPNGVSVIIVSSV